MTVIIALIVCATVLIVVSKSLYLVSELFHVWLETQDGASHQQQELLKLRDQLASLEDRHAEVSQKVRQALGQK